jgi:hypothetical protein
MMFPARSLALSLLLLACSGLSANTLTATLTGPVSPVTVKSDESGPNADGLVICSITLNAGSGGWSVTGLTISAASGAAAGDHNAAFSVVALYEVKPGGLVPAASPSVFTGNSVSFSLLETRIDAAQSRIYVLKGALNRTARSGETFGAALQAVSAEPDTPGGLARGVPTPFSTGLQIAPPTLLVRIGPEAHGDAVIMGELPATQLAGLFELVALNDDVTVHGLVLSGHTTGDWTAGVSTNGVRVYLRSGRASFNRLSDKLLFQGGGNSVVDAVFDTPLQIPANFDIQLWLAIELTGIAGDNHIVQLSTYSLEIADGAHVLASAPVALQDQPVATAELKVREFRVDSIDPLQDSPDGGSPIVITGAGFVHPVRVHIGGVVCVGTSVVSPDGISIAGLSVPPRPAGSRSTGLPIVIENGWQTSRTLSIEFDYVAPSAGNGCTIAAGATIPAFTLLLAIAGRILSRRRKP